MSAEPRFATKHKGIGLACDHREKRRQYDVTHRSIEGRACQVDAWLGVGGGANITINAAAHIPIVDMESAVVCRLGTCGDSRDITTGGRGEALPQAG